MSSRRLKGSWTYTLACVTPLLTLSSHTNYLSYFGPFSTRLTVSRKISQMCYALCKQFSGKGHTENGQIQPTLFALIVSCNNTFGTYFLLFRTLLRLYCCLLVFYVLPEKRAQSEISPTLITQLYISKYLKDQFKSLYFELDYVFHEM